MPAHSLTAAGFPYPRLAEKKVEIGGGIFRLQRGVRDRVLREKGEQVHRGHRVYDR